MNSIQLDPNEIKKLSPAERREYNILQTLDVRRDIRSAFKGALIGIVVNSLWQSFADWLFPSNSSYTILFWFATLFIVLGVFRLWNQYDENQRYRHVQTFEKERARRKAHEFDPHNADIAARKQLITPIHQV